MDKLLKSMPLFYYDITAIIIFCILLIALRSKNNTIRKRVLYVMCCVNFIFYIVNDYYFYLRGDNILTLMPLQLCNIAVFLVPISLILNKQAIMDFVFYICAPGALAALLVPSSDYIGITYSLMTISFFAFHFMIVAIPFLLVGWGIYKPTPGINKAVKLSIAVFGLASIMHLLNLILGIAFHVEANYFFTIIKYSAPRNPLFELFSKIIPYDLFYLLPSLLVLYIYMLIIYVLTRLKLTHIKIKSHMVSKKHNSL